MTHDVFISHSTLDKLAADAVCHGLEAKGVRCWMAPRDQIAGKAYGQQITEAIRDASVMVLVFSEHVNDSQAVLNEINLAAAASVTIVPFRIASVAFNPELNYYLGRTHWLDAFPQPVDAYIDALANTVRRNLPPPAADAATVAAPPTADPTASAGAPGVAAAPSPPSPPSPAAGPTVAPAAAVAGHPPHRTNYMPVMIVGLVLAFVFAIVLVAMFHKPSREGERQATILTQAVANAIQEGAKDDDKSDQDSGAQAAASGPQPPHGDGSELTPLGRPKPAFVKFYQTELLPGGPPEGLQGAILINSRELIQSMRERDAGMKPFWLIDARGCTEAPTIPTAECLAGNTIQELQAKVPNKAAQLVLFGQDGANASSFNLASQAVAAGYSNVFWYRGGVSAWAAAGEPTVARSAGGGQ